MKKLLRICSLILAMLMVILVVVACAKDEGGSETGDADSYAAIGTDGEVDYFSDVPSGRYDGYEFRIMSCTHGWASVDMLGELGTGNYNKDIYTRNITVMDKLGITITQDTADGAAIDTILQKQGMSGDDSDSYDVYWQGAGRIQLRAMEGLMLDLNDLDKINFSKPWWYTDFMEENEISDRSYVAYGSINTVYYAAFGLCAFNKDILETIDPNVNLYEVYDAGKWTWETMYGYMKDASEEVNGDSERMAADDKFGLAIHNNTLMNFLLTANERIVEKDKNGTPTYMGADEGFISAWEFIVDKASDPQLTCAPGITAGYSEYSSKGGSFSTAFNEGRALFLLQGAGAFSRNEGANIPYGLVGYPKPSETDEYRTPVYFGLSGMCVPFVCSDPERTGTIIENLAAYSYGTVDKGYIESVLYYKYAKDADATKVIAQVFEQGVVDLALINTWGSMGGTITTALKNRNKDVVSLFEQNESKIKGAMEKAIIFLSR